MLLNHKYIGSKIAQVTIEFKNAFYRKRITFPKTLVPKNYHVNVAIVYPFEGRGRLIRNELKLCLSRRLTRGIRHEKRKCAYNITCLRNIFYVAVIYS